MKWLRRRSTRAIGAAVLTCGLVAAGVTATGALAQSGEPRTVDYHGYSVAVPAAWRVVDLRTHPETCVQATRPTVYLGHPGDESDCRSDAVGRRTASVMIQPLDNQSAERITGDVATATRGSAAAPESATPADGSTQLVVEDAGVLVTADYGADYAKPVRQMLAGAELGSNPDPVRLKSLSKPEAEPRQDPIVAPGTFNDLAFDTCDAPSQGAMDAWQSSPYKAVGIYTSGFQRACASQPNLSPDWVRTQYDNGWQFILIDVGLQSPCLGRLEPFSTDPATARQQGRDAAAGAIEDATALGFGPGSAIYSDIEHYSNSETCRVATAAYVSGWTEALNDQGWLGGVYSNPPSGIGDLSSTYDDPNYTSPDHIWFALWNDQQDVDASPWVPGDQWANGRRMHQYQGDVTESHGGVSINIDRNYAELGDPGPCGRVSLDFEAYPDLESGASGAEVEAAQCALDAAGHKPGGGDPYEPTGEFDQGTTDATKAFQTEVGLEASGTLDAHTWTALLSAGDTPVLSNGSSGSAVSRLQRALTAALGKTVGIDGAFGPNTEAAVTEYQTNAGLDADGVVGEQTWGALQAGK